MKKIIALLLCLVLLAVSSLALAESESDKAYVTGKGKIVVGITDFEPMDYKNENGEWIGFDADLARAFAAYLGVEIEFQEIDWDNKVLELTGKNIDCVWNGMSLTDEVKAAMSCSKAYMNNAQVIVAPVAKVADYTTVESLSSLVFAVESGSSGESVVRDLGCQANAVQSQAAALMEVASGTSDAAVIDLLMALAMVGEGTGYENLACGFTLQDDQYGVGFRPGSDLAEELNTFLASAAADGTLKKIADTYGLGLALIAD
ncbi:MAG: transporter substrate-binding domain-containing protein [Clostridia bacterium]|nr:transporter substrate-binding domain-containing protein [Clostridia bacterium]